MKKGISFFWNEDCQNAYDEIKKYLMNPHVLARTIKGKLLIRYTRALENSLGA